MYNFELDIKFLNTSSKDVTQTNLRMFMMLWYAVEKMFFIKKDRIENNVKQITCYTVQFC